LQPRDVGETLKRMDDDFDMRLIEAITRLPANVLPLPTWATWIEAGSPDLAAATATSLASAAVSRDGQSSQPCRRRWASPWHQPQRHPHRRT
jgi:hypothetical protein